MRFLACHDCLNNRDVLRLLYVLRERRLNTSRKSPSSNAMFATVSTGSHYSSVGRLATGAEATDGSTAALSRGGCATGPPEALSLMKTGLGPATGAYGDNGVAAHRWSEGGKLAKGGGKIAMRMPGCCSPEVAAAAAAGGIQVIETSLAAVTITAPAVRAAETGDAVRGSSCLLQQQEQQAMESDGSDAVEEGGPDIDECVLTF